MESKQVDQLIVDLIKNKKIARQSELLALLAASGVSITQPNLSRRMEKLQLRKAEGYYILPIKVELKYDHIKSIDLAPPNLMLIHTSAGFAGSVATEIDQIRREKGSKLGAILGTIAGDDTILVITQDNKKLLEMHSNLLNYFSNKSD